MIDSSANSTSGLNSDDAIDPQLCPLVAATLFDSDIVHLLLDIFAVHVEWKLQVWFK